MKIVLLGFLKPKIIIFILPIFYILILLTSHSFKVRADAFYPGDIYKCEFGAASGVQYQNPGGGSVSFNNKDLQGQAGNWIESTSINQITNVNDLYGARYDIGNSVSVPPNTKVEIGYWGYNNAGEEVSVKGIDLFTSHSNLSNGDLTNLGAGGVYGTTCDTSTHAYCRSGKKLFFYRNDSFPTDPVGNAKGQVFYSFTTIQPIQLVSFNSSPSWQGGNLTVSYSLNLKNVSNYNICGINLSDTLPSGNNYTNNLCLNSGETKTINFNDVMGENYTNAFNNSITINDTSTHYEAVAFGKQNEYDISPETRALFVWRNDLDQNSDPNWTAPQTGWAGMNFDNLAVKLIPYSFNASTAINLPSQISLNKTVSDAVEVNVKTSHSNNRDNISYSINISNSGGREALTIYDQYDKNNIDILDTDGGVINNGIISWQVTLEHNSSINFLIKAEIKNLNQGSYDIVNKVFTSDNSIPTSQADSLVNTKAILSLQKTLTDFQIINGKSDTLTSNANDNLHRSITFNLNYTNTGDADAHNVILVDDLSQFAQYGLIGTINSISSNGVYSSQKNNITWNLVTLNHNTNGSVRFTIILNKTILDGLSILNNATLTSDENAQLKDSTTTNLIYTAPLKVMAQTGGGLGNFTILILILSFLSLLITNLYTYLKTFYLKLKSKLYFKKVLFSLTFFLVLSTNNLVYAATKKSSSSAKVTDVIPTNIQAGSPIQFGTLDNLLWSIIATIQLYTLPIMAITIAFLGIKLVMSGEDTSLKEIIKAWITKILIGGFMIFSASTLASLIKTAVGG